jgi:hypothetical protein
MSEFDERSYPISAPPKRVRSIGEPLESMPPQRNDLDSERLDSDIDFQADDFESGEAAGRAQATLLLNPPHSEELEATSLSPSVSGPASLVDQLVARANCPHPLRHPIRFFGWAISMVFGIVTLVLALAVVAAIPIVNFIALGYLLEVEGRVARSGRFRDAFPLLPLAPRVGGMVLGIWIWLTPLRFIAWAAADARLIAPGSPADIGWHVALRIAMVLITIHLCLSLARGGRLSCFFRPFKNLFWLRRQWKAGGYWDRAEQAVWDFLNQFRRSYYFWKGFKAWAGAALWLIIPTLLFAAAKKPNGVAAIISIAGGVLLAIVFTWVPFLQARFSIDGRFAAFKELKTIREMYRRAPLCWALATIVTYALSLPLFLSTIVLPPQDALWLVTPIFIISIYPARVLTGWAYFQAAKRETRAWFSLRFVTGLVLMPLVMVYTFILFFTQFIGSSGKLVLFQHHALLLPRPF